MMRGGKVTEPAYDTIGRGYAAARRPDPRIAVRIEAALGDCQSVVNVGAGAGSYEPADREVIAVEPSAEMIAQRPKGAARVVQATAEDLPFDDDSFDAAMAIITIHHWDDVDAGLTEMIRVARKRVLILSIDPEVVAQGWIASDYFPDAAANGRSELLPIAELRAKLPSSSVEVVPGPRRCRDAFAFTLWDQPERLLDPAVRRASSVWHRIPVAALNLGLKRLREDLESGEWDRKYGHLRELGEFDIGLRLVVSELSLPSTDRPQRR
jgi:SAM-dependent methyltransferase